MKNPSKMTKHQDEKYDAFLRQRSSYRVPKQSISYSELIRSQKKGSIPEVGLPPKRGMTIEEVVSKYPEQAVRVIKELQSQKPKPPADGITLKTHGYPPLMAKDIEAWVKEALTYPQLAGTWQKLIRIRDLFDPKPPADGVGYIYEPPYKHGDIDSVTEVVIEGRSFFPSPQKPKVSREWVKSLLHDMEGESTAIKEQLVEVWLKQIGVEVEDEK